LQKINNKNKIDVLDIGCGCGILSFLFLKKNKKSKVFGIDKNDDAVKTYNLNAPRLEFREA